MILYQLNNNRIKLKKKRGNTLIEAVAAISIIVIAINILYTSVTYANKCKSVSTEYEQANRVIHSIQNEIKYNYKLEEIINLLDGKPLNLKKDNILMELRNKNLDEICRGDDIVITLEDKRGLEILFKVKYNINVEEGKSIEEIYIKSERMEKA